MLGVVVLPAVSVSVTAGALPQRDYRDGIEVRLNLRSLRVRQCDVLFNLSLPGVDDGLCGGSACHLVVLLCEVAFWFCYGALCCVALAAVQRDSLGWFR